MDRPLLELEAVSKTYGSAAASVVAVRDVSASIQAGEFVALVGPSGCGKSTLLHLCGAMDRPTRGRILFDGIALGGLDDGQLTRWRRERVGFVFQFFNLLPTLTVVENIALPRLLAGARHATVMRRARELADVTGLDQRHEHYPQQLSGGEQQRCAIARAVMHEPALLIADEPTGSLDSATGTVILDLLCDLHARVGTTLLLATHAADVAAAADTILYMRDGRLERDVAPGPRP